MFAVWGIPIKRRARHARNGRVYVDSRTRKEMADVADAYARHSHGKLKGPVLVKIDVFPKLPKSKPKHIEGEYSTNKPDVDNVAKLVLDALSKAGAWDDDSQVTTLIVRKHPRKRTNRDSYTLVSVSEDRSMTW